jgi:uncharacterized protein
MIIACFIKKQKKIVAFNIEGHAEYAEEGSDIVCSAVSAVSIGTANGIEEILKIKPRCYMEDGYLNLSLQNNTFDEIEKSQVLLETMLLSFNNLQDNYSDYINVIVEEVQ